MTLTDAKTYIARVIGGQNDAGILALAADAVLVTAEKWSRAHDWEWLRKDNSKTRSLTGTVADAGGGSGTVLTLTSTAGINVGQVVTGLSVSTTVASITSTTVLVLADSVTAGAVTAVFAAYVPVISGTDTYYLPHDFQSLYGARLLTSKRDLKVVRLREVNRQVLDQSATGFANTIVPGIGGDAGGGWTAADTRDRARLVGIPDTTELMHLDYYRAIDGSASTVDVHPDVLYAFLDDAKAWLVRQRNAQDPRADILEGLARAALRDAIAADRDIPDEDIRMKSQMETFRPFTYTPRLPYDY